MITSQTQADDARTLAAYLGQESGGTPARVSASRGLLAIDLAGMGAELQARAARSRTGRPILHVHANPDPSGPIFSEADWWHHWAAYEQEFGLNELPWMEVTHLKAGREHRHRLYLRVRRNGTCVGLSHDRPRLEYLSRRTEHRVGARLVAGRHNRAVAGRLRREGHEEVAAAMVAAGLLDHFRPAAMGTAERRQADRTGVPVLAVEAAILAAWQTSNGDQGLRAALAEHGLLAAEGERTVVVRDAAGGVHGVRRLLNRAGHRAGLPDVSLATIRARLEQGWADEVGSAFEEVRREQVSARPNPIHHVLVDAQARRDRDRAIFAGTSEPAGPPGLERAGMGGYPGRSRSGAPADPAGTVENFGRGPDWRSDRGDRRDGRAGRGARAADETADSRRRAQRQIEAARFRQALALPGPVDRLAALLTRVHQPVQVSAPAEPPVPRTVTLTAQGPGYDPRVHRPMYAAWLEAARRDEYQTGWLPESIAARITGVGLLQGQTIVRIEMAGGVLYDAYRRITWRGDPKAMRLEEWTELVVLRGWGPTPAPLPGPNAEDTTGMAANVAVASDEADPSSWKSSV